MPRVTINTSEALSFEPVQPGPYPCHIKAISGVEQGEKAKYVRVDFSFADPAVAQRAGTLFRNYPIEGKGAGFFRDFWKAATGEDIPVGTQLDIDTDSAIGRPVICNVENREYEGRLQNEVKSVAAG